MSQKKYSHSEKGQVAIFVALIFQVLFVFFAMIINVGLLVHHKINLQNSVDLAAYYGAAKQAEMMNAVGHVNYQIRQAYKLWMFRYTQLGSAGDVYDHPYRPTSGSTTSREIVDAGEAKTTLPSAFCFSYSPVSFVNTGGNQETYCKKLSGIQIPQPGVPVFGAGAGFFENIQRAFIEAAQSFRDAATSACYRNNLFTWSMYTQFYNAYRRDVVARKKTLIGLANAISQNGNSDSFTDIDGQPIKLGVYKTLLKNLTPPNQDSMKSVYGEEGNGAAGNSNATFQIYNGLSDANCGYSGDPDLPPKWLSEMFYYPEYYYFLGQCKDAATGSADIKIQPYSYSNDAVNTNTMNEGLIDRRNGGTKFLVEPGVYKSFMELNAERPGNDAKTKLERSSFGFEKNPWCMAYVAVQAQTKPSIPFSPLGSVFLQAKAYAKPFGSRVGPWWWSKWPKGPSEERENQNLPDTDKVDVNLPVRLKGGSNPYTTLAGDPNFFQLTLPNHARYVGDKEGIRSKRTMSQFGKEIHSFGNNSGSILVTEWWKDIVEASYSTSTTEDYLAYGTDPGAQKMRSLEIAAIKPDMFDVTYYSIDPSFSRNYGKRLNAGYSTKLGFRIRPDLGARKSENNLVDFGIVDQISTTSSTGSAASLSLDPSVLTYQIKAPANGGVDYLLNAWQGKNPEDFSLNRERFMKCATRVDITDDNALTPGNCAFGGRAGYSVKIISEDFLRSSNLQLGGDGVAADGILNPPAF